MFRQIRRYRETYSWNPININFENYAIQSGLLDGIENIKSPIRLSFMPMHLFIQKHLMEIQITLTIMGWI